MQVLNTVQTAQETFSSLKGKERIALVPTMGCLHEGHLALVKLAKEQARKIVVSIFVNPLQFGANEDFDKYPRTLEEDQEKLTSLGVDYLFHPTVEDFYPPHFSGRIQVGEIGERLCGRFRPGHFNGVATVCLKLFQATFADVAVFGEKDYQQLQVIHQLARDFHLPLKIISSPTIREKDGLAMSSRNRYLSPQERAIAATIPETLIQLKEALAAKPSVSVGELLKKARANLIGIEIQYAEITEGPHLVSAPDTALISDLNSPRFFIALKIGNTRLIDNMSLRGLP